MNIALYDADKTRFPNLALMKLSAWHKKHGDSLVWYDELFSASYDKIYASKVFTYPPEALLFGSNIEYGGMGYNVQKILPDKIEHICPDYSLYSLDYSLGFLTRGCLRKCSWCIVPEKEGKLRAHADIEEFLRHDQVVLLDNNILASEHGIKQIERLGKLQVKVDFNQGLDARYIDQAMAKRLATLKWIRFIRFSCDTQDQLPILQQAITWLRWENVNPARIFVYCLIREIPEALDRIKFLKGLYVDVFAQPYQDKAGTPPTREQQQFARWVNHKAIFKSISWEEYFKHI